MRLRHDRSENHQGLEYIKRHLEGVAAMPGEVIEARLDLNQVASEDDVGRSGGGGMLREAKVGATSDQSVAFQFGLEEDSFTVTREKVMEGAVWSEPVEGRAFSQD